MNPTRRPMLRASALFTALAGIGFLAGLGGPAQSAGLLPTTTTVVASPASSSLGQAVTLTATVKVLDLNGLLVTPSGTVSFTNGTQALGAAPLPDCSPAAPCSTSLTTTSLPVGSDTVTATYSGDALTSSSSGTTTVQVSANTPGAPTLTGVALVGSNQLTWRSASDGGSTITSYRLYRSTGGPYSLIATVPTGDYQDTTVVAGSTYSYRATTVNAAGESPYSNVVTLTAASGSSGSYSTTTCSPGVTCSSPTDTATSPSGSQTTGQIVVEPSTAAHVATFSFGGPNLSTCHLPAVGVTAAFNDTSQDAYKQVSWKVTGHDADVMHSWTNPTPGYVGCLGLGTPWYAGSTSNPAVWVPQDGLYEATPPLCANNGAFALPDGHFSQPCVTTISSTNGNVSDHFLKLVYNLPPGDGRIGSGT